MVLIIFQIITVTQIYTTDPDIDWTAVNAMPHKDALEYLDRNSITVTGIDAFIRHIKEPITWPYFLMDVLYRTLSFFISFLALLFWIHKSNAV